MKIGDKVIRTPETFGGIPAPMKGEPRTPKEYSGRVIYLHPEGRYHMVEFELRGGNVRECFMGV